MHTRSMIGPCRLVPPSGPRRRDAFGPVDGVREEYRSAAASARRAWLLIHARRERRVGAIERFEGQPQVSSKPVIDQHDITGNRAVKPAAQYGIAEHRRKIREVHVSPPVAAGGRDRSGRRRSQSADPAARPGADWRAKCDRHRSEGWRPRRWPDATCRPPCPGSAW